MHQTDKRTGETLEKEMEGDRSAAPTQPAQHVRSEDGGASGVRGDPTEQLTEILGQLQKPTSAISHTEEVWQLRKRVQELEQETGVDLGTISADNVDAQILLNAQIEKLKDDQLGRALAHHNFVFKLPADWFPEWMEVKESGYVKAKLCYGQKSTGRHLIQLAISHPHLTKKQKEKGMSDDYVWWMRKLLDVNFDCPKTLEDIGLTMTTVEQ
eukprot:2331563-Rhodomonas_salina.1